MKIEQMECYQRYANQVIKEMKEPERYLVDFVPEFQKVCDCSWDCGCGCGWKNKSNIDNHYHTQRIWLKINQMLNRCLLGRHIDRPSKRPFLLHSFNSFETYKKKKKRNWPKINPHLHSVLFVHPRIKDRFKELLVIRSRKHVEGLIENFGVNFSTPYTIRPDVFWMANGINLNYFIKSLQIRIPYDLEGKVDYSLGLFETWKPIHPDNVFKDDLEEKQDGMNVFILPSEYDFKRKIMVNPFGKVEEGNVSLELGAGVS